MLGEPGRGDGAEGPFAGGGEPHHELPGRIGQGQADVAVVELQHVVVAAHDHRPAGVPGRSRVGIPRGQGLPGARLQHGVDLGKPAPAAARGAQHAVVGEGAGRPGHVGGILPHGRQVGLVGGQEVVEVGCQARAPEHLQQLVDLALVHEAGQVADARAGLEAMAAREPHHGVVQRARLLGRRWLDPGLGQPGERRQRLAAGRAQGRVGAELGEDGAGLDGGELVAVAQQHDARVRRHGLQQVHGQREVKHRGFVDDEHVQGQRVRRVVREAAVGAAAQQAVHGTGLLRQGGTPGLGQPRPAFAQRLEHARGRLAGGGGQGDAAVRVVGQQARQQRRHRGGLAGARPAADHGQAAAAGQRGGQHLPVGGWLVPGRGIDG